MVPKLLRGCQHRHAYAGEFDERVFVGLDFVLAEAQRRDLLVLLTLTNYWADYGGMTQVGWRTAIELGCWPSRDTSSTPTTTMSRTLLQQMPCTVCQQCAC